MIKIDFEEPKVGEDKNWDDWRNECKQAQKMLNEAHARGKTPPAIKSETYKGKKFKIKDRYYFGKDTAFHGKCAYCEQQITAPKNQPGDVEHFRPKKAVHDIHNKPVFIARCGQAEPPPGYYWLAYDWRNLLPSCISCNRLERDEDNNLIGKGNRFPVCGDYATQPGEEVYETPLLLHPVFDDPAKHLELHENGSLFALTPQGKACIDVFGLNFRGLPDARKKVYEDFKNKAGSLLRALHIDPEGKEAQNLFPEIESILAGKEAHTVAALKAREDSRSTVSPAIGLLGLNDG